jgi:hypothetical protein
MFLETDDTVRDVFTDLHARSIVACGGLKESIQDLKRDVMMAVYEVKDRREVTDEVLADLLGISDRWLRMLGDTKPAKPPVSDGRKILLLLQTHAEWLSLNQLMDRLRDAEEFSGPRRVQRLLTGLIELGQVEVSGRGKERLYRSTSRISVHIATKRERAKEARKRLTSLPTTVRDFIHQKAGSLCSRYQYRIRRERLAIVAERIREAISEILQEEEKLCAQADPSESVEYTVLVNAAMGISGTSGQSVPGVVCND